jgi:hypothetical protein
LAVIVVRLDGDALGAHRAGFSLRLRAVSSSEANTLCQRAGAPVATPVGYTGAEAVDP